MKHAVIHLQLSPKVFGREVAERLSPLEVRGYACEVAGEPMVAHRALDKGADGLPELSTERWSVSEPRTGMLVRKGLRGQKREEVVWQAEQLTNLLGGRDTLLEVIEEKTAEPVAAAA